MFPLDSIMYEGMGLRFNQTHVSWYWWCWLFKLMLVALIVQLMLVASKLVFEESLVYSLFIDVLWFRYRLHSELFWLYALLLAIYMRNFAYLCIMVWILMDAHGFVDICIKIYYIKNALETLPDWNLLKISLFAPAPTLASHSRFPLSLPTSCSRFLLPALAPASAPAPK